MGPSLEPQKVPTLNFSNQSKNQIIQGQPRYSLHPSNFQNVVVCSSNCSSSGKLVNTKPSSPTMISKLLNMKKSSVSPKRLSPTSHQNSQNLKTFTSQLHKISPKRPSAIASIIYAGAGLRKKNSAPISPPIQANQSFQNTAQATKCESRIKLYEQNIQTTRFSTGGSCSNNNHKQMIQQN